MAKKTMTLTLNDGQTWIYPALTYTGYDGVYKKKNHWYKGHSVTSRRGKYCYQGGTSDSDGKYNGNMLSIFLFKDSSGKTLKNAIKAIGGSGKITKITLKMYISNGWGGYFSPRICMTPYWDTSSLTGKAGDTYDAVGFKHIYNPGALKRDAWHELDLTSYKKHFDTYESLAFYAPGTYNASNSSYGAIHAQKESKPPTLIIEYNTNSAPSAPSVSVTSTKDSNGYTLPSLKFKITSNGDPDNNLHSSPYNYKIYNQSGSVIKEGSWSSSNSFTFDASKYRGQTLKIRGIVRDTEGLTAYKETNAYINSLPNWASGSSMTFSSGVTNGVFENNVTMKWSAATDAQSSHKSNLRYSVYVQKGTDKGASGDTSSNCIASNLTGTSYTVNASNMSQMAVAKGDRIYFSVWVSDGLEWSSGRLTTSWIYREKPPTAPSNVAPTSGYYEDSVKVTWAAASGLNGSTISSYTIKLLNKDDKVLKTYTSKTTSYTCTDITLIPRGQTFKFQVYATDNLGNNSTSAYSGNLTRNPGPTKPTNFRINSNETTFKESIPLAWNASTCAEGAVVKYDVYFSRTDGVYRSIATGISQTYCTHDISSEAAGTKFDYYVVAYDSFGIYSDKTTLTTRPQVNIPPKTPTFTLPLSNTTIYTNQPRIIFNTNEVYNSKSVKVTITVNGVTYNSNDATSYFDKKSYTTKENGMFIIPESAPLNYSKVNTITIKSNDGLDNSGTNSHNIAVDFTTVDKIGTNEERFIKASEINNIKKMIDSSRYAYNLKAVKWDSGLDKDNKVLKSFFEQAIDNVHEISTILNSKTTNKSCHRLYTKDTVSVENLIKKSMFNNLINVITKP